MTKIQSAIRDGQRIEVLLIDPPQEEEKIRVFLVGPGGAKATKPLRKSGQKKCSFQFGDEAEAKLYKEAYLDGLGIEKTRFSIVEKAALPDMIAAFFQKVPHVPKLPPVRFPRGWRKPMLFIVILLGCLFLGHQCSSSASRPRVENLKAYFVSLDRIQVQGEIRFPDTILHTTREKLLERLSLELWEEGKQIAIEKTTEEIFYKNFTYERKHQQGPQEIHLVLDGTVLHKTKVEYHPSWPIFAIENAFWEGVSVRVTLACIQEGEGEMHLELMPKTKEGKKGSVVAQCSVSTKKTNRFLLGPIPEYYPLFSVVLRSASGILSEKDIACSLATGQIDAAKVEEPGSLFVLGTWKGPSGALVELEIWDIERRAQVSHEPAPQNFSLELALEDTQSRYEARLKHESRILSSKEVVISERVEHYALARQQMPAFLKVLEGILLMPLSEGILKMQALKTNVERHAERMEAILSVWEKESLKKTVLSMRSFYSHFNALGAFILEQKERAIAQNQPNLLAIGMMQEKDFSFLLDSLEKSLVEVHPSLKEKNLLSRVPLAFEKKEEETRYQNLIQYITESTQAKDLSLALRMCDMALTEFPDSWHFLLARYNLYLLSHRKLYLEIYAEKAQSDHKALVALLTKNFEQLYKTNQKAQAYVLGTQLVELDDSLKAIAQKVESLRHTVPLPEKLEALLSFQNFRFPFVVQKKQE